MPLVFLGTFFGYRKQVKTISYLLCEKHISNKPFEIVYIVARLRVQYLYSFNTIAVYVLLNIEKSFCSFILTYLHFVCMYCRFEENC